jgi:hypothetical protein
MEIRYRDRQVGSIAFSKAQSLAMQRGFDSIEIGVPFDFRLEAPVNGKHWMLSDLSLDIFVRRPVGDNWLLASGAHKETFRSATGPLDLPRNVNARCSPRALAQYEALRDGGPVRLQSEIRGRVSGLLNLNGSDLVVNPSPVFGTVEIELSREHWTAALRKCGLSASVLVEIPIPVGEAFPLDTGLRALLDAAEAFDQGGPRAWKNSVGHIRPFIEQWRNREALPHAEPKDGSASDRRWKLLNLRDALYKCCHFWVHESRDACRRRDAVMVLATFASLLEG